MKILQIHTTLRSGGIEAFVTSLSNELCKTEEVSVCTIFTPKADDVFEKQLSSKIKRITLGKQGSGFSVRSVWRIFKTILHGKYDVVHMHGCFYYYLLSVFLLHRRVKFIYTIHTVAERENIGWDLKLLPFKRLAFKWEWMHAVTISKDSQQSFETVYSNTSNRLIVNGIARPAIDVNTFNADNFRITPNTKLFVHAGRITEAKNQIVLCATFKHLIDEGNDVMLLMCGANEDKAIFESLTPYFCDRIIYLGERSDVTSIMAKCDAFCLPSIWEGMPIALFEAMAVGCIPICSPVGGIPDVISHCETGFLSTNSSERGYRKVIEEFLSQSEADLQSIKIKTQEEFLKYDISRTAHEYLNYYS